MAKWSPRKKQFMAFLLAELLVIGCLMLQTVAFYHVRMDLGRWGVKKSSCVAVPMSAGINAPAIHVCLRDCACVCASARVHVYVWAVQTSRTLVALTAEKELKLMQETYFLKIKRMTMSFEGGSLHV